MQIKQEIQKLLDVVYPAYSGKTPWLANIVLVKKGNIQIPRYIGYMVFYLLPFLVSL